MTHPIHRMRILAQAQGKSLAQTIAEGKTPEEIRQLAQELLALAGGAGDPKRFASEFIRAFQELDAKGLNFVKLSALRKALPQYDRASFDEGLRAMRVAGTVQLDPAEGTHDRNTDEDRAAGIVEAGMRLMYARLTDTRRMPTR